MRDFNSPCLGLTRSGSRATGPMRYGVDLLLGRKSQGREVGPDDDFARKAAGFSGGSKVSFRDGLNRYLIWAVI